MKKRFIIILYIAAMAMLPARAQVLDSEFRSRLDAAKVLYLKGMYVSAEEQLDRLARDISDKKSLLYSEVLANKVMCAIALDRTDADGLLTNLETEFPNDPQLAMVKYNLGVVKFDEGDYAQALAMFGRINEKNLYKTVRTEFNFKRAYCNMNVGNYAEALNDYEKVRSDKRSSYTNPAIYYSAYVHYMTKEFSRAYDLFQQVANDARFKDLAAYYGIECKFMLEDYNYVVQKGQYLYNSLEKDLKINLVRMLSESCFALQNSRQAKEYLDMYQSLGATLNRKDHFFAGLVEYSLYQYQDAIDHFAHVTSKEDALGQSAYYYSANSYLQQLNKISALDCFKAASECSFDPEIREDSFFNYAKLTFDVNSDISQFERYVELYPGSGKDDVINTYMSVAFLRNRDYESAIETMRKVKRPSKELASNLQKAMLFRGVELINLGSYRSAGELLESAAEAGYDKTITDLATFYLAECYFNNDKFSDALDLQEDLLKSKSFRKTYDYINLQYDLGYTYFKLGDYKSASDRFNSYLEADRRGGGVYEHDARLRLADSYFMLGKYAMAADEYEFVGEYYNDNDIYAKYQAALANGLIGKNDKKIDILNKALQQNPSASLYGQGLFELGRTYVQVGNNQQATACFETLLSRKDSLYHAKSLIELAMISSNKGDHSKALSYYDKVVRTHPRSSEANDALSGIESIYQMQNKPEQYLAYLDRVGLSSVVSADDKEAMIFAAAEQNYYAAKNSSTVSSLRSYLDKYPHGKNAASAWFYLGECYRTMGRREFAADAYASAMELSEGEMALAATLSYADISFSLNRYTDAGQAYETVLAIADKPEIVAKATVSHMLCFFGNKQYFKALKEANSIVAGDGFSQDDIRKAQYIAAKSHMVLGERAQARPILEKLAKDVQDEIGAECAFLIIQDLYDSGDFVNVENKVYALSDSGTSQLYWLARSFIVLADSFGDRQLWEQSRATLESIKDEYTSQSATDDVLEQVEARLNKMASMGY